MVTALFYMCFCYISNVEFVHLNFEKNGSQFNEKRGILYCICVKKRYFAPLVDVYKSSEKEGFFHFLGLNYQKS